MCGCGHLSDDTVAKGIASVLIDLHCVRVGVVLARTSPVHGVVGILSHATRILEVGKADSASHLHELQVYAILTLTRAVERLFAHIVHLHAEVDIFALELGVHVEILAVLAIVGDYVVVA